jgi:hypothetical protein
MKAYEEVIEFIATMNPHSLINFKPSVAVNERVTDLINREKHAGLSPEEKSELDNYERLEHLMRMAKARAHKLISR